MRSLLVAVAFLTRVPVRIDATAADVRIATRWFPVVGAAIGGIAAALITGLDAIELPPIIIAILTVALLAGVTGALHLDGLADMADGFGGGRTKDDILRIMRDPRVGAFGAVTLILVLLLQVSILATLLERRTAVATVIASLTLSRWTAVALGACLPYARESGGVGEAATGDTRFGLAIATVTAAAVSFGLVGIPAAALWAATVCIATVVGVASYSRIGGITGDVFGATVELSVTAALLVGLLVRR